LKIFTIGIGTAAGDSWCASPMPTAIPITSAIRKRQRVKSQLNENLLQQIATRPADFTCRCAARTRWTTLYERGLAPCRNRRQEKLMRRYHEQFQWPLAIAILLLLAEIFLPERKSRKSQNQRSKVKAAAIAVLLFVLLSGQRERLARRRHA
jgi:Ca-activated chloride channel family protein